MSKEYLVEIYYPIVNESFDIYIPKNIKISKLINLLLYLFNNKYQNSLMVGDLNKRIVLCESKTGKMLDINFSVEQAGIKNGTTLMLI